MQLARPERDLGRAQRRCKFGRRVVHLQNERVVSKISKDILGSKVLQVLATLATSKPVQLLTV